MQDYRALRAGREGLPGTGKGLQAGLRARAPVLFRVAPLVASWGFGDVVTRHFHGQRQDPSKAAAMAAAGAAVGAPASAALAAWMGAAWPGGSLGVAAGKFALDQAVGWALWMAAYASLPGNEWYGAALLRTAATARAAAARAARRDPGGGGAAAGGRAAPAALAVARR
ncbi:hypothetical protein Rsub_05571 [Raphidocelis subcapitata]|uniref:Uncharacterized protein n=1 Tax=Raphidocelis subcapitata TaxID=307507 RepID=A0A2V0NYG4_9CHLO|nr:hypothetical protein Rsub_05571 [Raphidocelis subcapitata]|eukprot:GBF92369.1 hypothetical protein Rsub_05571 [Raphidocelis subcapitata]